VTGLGKALIIGAVLACLAVWALLVVLPGFGADWSPAAEVTARKLVSAVFVEWESCTTRQERGAFIAGIEGFLQGDSPRLPHPLDWDYAFLKKHYRFFVHSDDASGKWAVVLLPLRARKYRGFLNPHSRAYHDWFVADDGSVRICRKSTARKLEDEDVLPHIQAEIARGDWYVPGFFQPDMSRALRPWRSRHVSLAVRPVEIADGDDDVAVELTVTNSLASEITFPSRPGGGSSDSYEIDTPSGAPVPLKAGPVPKGDLVRLPAGETWSGAITLSDYFGFTEPGRYRCRILLPITFTNDAGKVFQWEVHSNQTALSVSSSASSDGD